MLGKLFCYDMKIQTKALTGVYLVALVISTIAAIIGGLSNAFDDVGFLAIAQKVTGMFTILAAIAVCVGTMIYLVLYFRRNLFKDEGYLMNTLPVTGTQLFMSKLITSFIFSIVSVVWAYICYGVSILDLTWGKKILDTTVEAGLDKSFWWMFLGVMFVSIVASMCQFYASICVGYTWKMNTATPVNRDIMSVVVYIIIYMVQQIAMLVAMAVFFVIRFGTIGTSMFTEGGISDSDVMPYISALFLLAGVLSVIIGVVLSAISIRRINHHMNLE